MQNISRDIYIDLLRFYAIAFFMGAVCGALLVLLDPWLRFASLPVRVNLQEALLGAFLLSSYSLLVAWLVSDFWRTGWLLMGMVFTAPLVTGSVILWNNLMAVLGSPSDYLLLIPAVFAGHSAVILSVTALLHLGLRLPVRRWFPYAATPLIIALLTFGLLGAIRWSTPDAKALMQQVNNYADGVMVEDDYRLEYLGIRYDSQLVGDGAARIYGAGITLYCEIDFFEPDRMTINCNQEG